MVMVVSVGPHSRLITTGLCSCSGVWDGHRESLVHPGLGNVAVRVTKGLQMMMIITLNICVWILSLSRVVRVK